MKRAVWALIGLSVLWMTVAQGQPHPFAVPETSSAPTGWFADWFGQISVWQSHFYRQLTGAVRAWHEDGAWLLIWLSFAYGVFHALGPGHGKAVISAFVLANHQSARNGALLAMLSALMQALVAIAMVSVLAGIFNVTAQVMNTGTRWLEMASYAFIVAVGLVLVWSRAIKPWLQKPAGQGGRHLHHAACGCGHVPPLSLMTGRLDWRRAWAAIVAVGLRPCSGALIVLVFALSQDLFGAGIAAAFAMGLGTGITVAALAMFAVWSKNALARGGSRVSSRAAARLRYAVESLAAVAVLLLGLLLLAGQIAGGA